MNTAVRIGRPQRVTLPASVRHHLHVSAPLESPWVWRGLAALTVVTVALLVGRAVRRRRRGIRPTHRWLRRVAAAGTVVVLMLVSGLAWLNTYAGYLPTVSSLSAVVANGQAVPGALTQRQVSDRTVAPSHSSVVQVEVGAAALHVPRLAAYVYLPPGYTDPRNAHRRYPVVYIIHGYPGRAADWMVAGGVPQIMDALIQQKVIGPMIVVAPNADGGYLHDAECLDQVGGPQIYDYLTTTIPTYVDEHFRTIRNRDGRAVAGLSSGGYCALNLGLRNQDEYAVMMGFEPYGDPGSSLVRSSLGGSWRAYDENSPDVYGPRMPVAHRQWIYLDAGGASPGDIRRVRGLADLLLRRGEPVAFRINVGQHHTWKEALIGLPYALDFAAHHLAGGLDRLASPGSITNIGTPGRSQTDRFARAPEPGPIRSLTRRT